MGDITRYINADEQIEVYTKAVDKSSGSKRWLYSIILEAFMNAPSFEVTQKVNAVWQSDYPDWLGAICSRCNKHSEYTYDYCPYCGAKMCGCVKTKRGG